MPVGGDRRVRRRPLPRESCGKPTTRGTSLTGPSKIDRIEADGAIAELPIAQGDVPEAAAVGPEGTVWFGIGRGSYDPPLSRVVRISSTGDLAEFQTPGAAFQTSIGIGPGNRLWFVRRFKGRRNYGLAAVNLAGQVSRPICIDRKCALAANGLTSGPEGTLLFSAETEHLTGGGGGSNLIAQEYAEKEAGYIWRLNPER